MLEVLEAGGLATLQDAGRVGWRRFGVPLAGPMDRFAFEAANLLAGNAPEATALEVGGGDLLLRAAHDCVIAAAGAGYQLVVNDWELPMWGSCFVRAGWQVRLVHAGFGMWAYVAVTGGIECPAVLGSHSTYLRGAFGGLEGRTLQPGDLLRSATAAHFMMENAARTLNEAVRPSYGPEPLLDVIAGPQLGHFAEQDVHAFFRGIYRVSAASDRMAYRLQGTPLLGHGRTELISEGMAAGSIQVPADGQPIAMMADSATTGGYPKIACLTSSALPLLAQCTPGQDAVRFRQVSVETAQAGRRAQVAAIRSGIRAADE